MKCFQIVKVTMLSVLCLGAWLVVDGQEAVEMSPAEQILLKQLSKKKAPKESEDRALEERLKKNNALYEEKRDKKDRVDKEKSGPLKTITDERDFLMQKAESIENSICVKLEKITEAQRAKTHFNMALKGFINERINDNSYSFLGNPVFRRSNVFKGNGQGKSLVVDLSHGTDADVMVVGGEVLTLNACTVQFVVLHRDGDSMIVKRAGEEIQLGPEDRRGEGDEIVYAKSVIFSDYDYFEELSPGDFFGIVVDDEAGITYDDYGVDSAAVIPLPDGALPETVPVPNPEPLAAPVMPKGKEAAGRYCQPRNEGRSFSFNLLFRAD